VSESSFNELVEKYGRKVFNLAFRISGNQQDAEDVAQETFLQVYRCLPGFRGESALYTWIYRIALNNSLKALKKNQTYAFLASWEEMVEQLGDNIPAEVQSWYADPEKAYLAKALTDEIQMGCLYIVSFVLTDDQRIPFTLRYGLDLSLAEIGEILEISENTVKARLHRARARLMEFLGDRCSLLNPENPCTCKSRVGMAMVLDPELVRRVSARAADNGLDKGVAWNGGTASMAEDAFVRALPPMEYETGALLQINPEV
jgi:RNA polymerase sigma-70 factor (ECF subfamily)